MTPRTYSYNEQMEETINQRIIRSLGYDRRPDKHPRCERPDERSSEFSKGSYLNDRRNFQRLFNINNYFSQTIEYDRFKIKRQDIGIFDLQFLNPKGQKAVTDGSRFVFTDVYDFIEYIYIFLKDNLTVYKTEQQIKAIFFTLLVGTTVI